MVGIAVDLNKVRRKLVALLDTKAGPNLKKENITMTAWAPPLVKVEASRLQLAFNILMDVD